MHVLTVFDHPQRKNFPGTVLDAFVEGITQAGHTAEVADLHAEGFDPRFTAEDHAHFWGGPRSADAAREAARVDAADALVLVLVFPVYCYGNRPGRQADDHAAFGTSMTSYPRLLRRWTSLFVERLRVTWSR